MAVDSKYKADKPNTHPMANTIKKVGHPGHFISLTSLFLRGWMFFARSRHF
jgi:hypothetical protein